jgi:hypothetical protein
MAAAGLYQINFGPISGAATTTLIAEAANQIKVREFRLWVNNGSGAAFRVIDSTPAALMQGATGANINGNAEIGLSWDGTNFVFVCAATKDLQLVTAGTGTFGGSIQYTIV